MGSSEKNGQRGSVRRIAPPGWRPDLQFGSPPNQDLNQESFSPELRRAPPFLILAILLCLSLAATGCKQPGFPTYSPNHREFAYITNSGSNTVTVLDVVNMRQDRTLAVGADPSGITASHLRHEVYVVNSGSGTVSVIDSRKNAVVATIAVHRQPYSIDVDARGRRAYVANSKSNTVSVLDLETRREIANIAVGKGPGLARIAPDGNSLVVSNRISGTVSIVDPRAFRVRSTFSGCPGATGIVILPDSSKSLIACSGGHQVMVLRLAHPQGPEPVASDSLLDFLDVGKTPIQIALKPDGGEAFVSNYDSGTISEIATSSNEVGGAYLVGNRPVRGLVSADNSLLYISNFSTGIVSVYGIDDGKLLTSIRVGEGPDALAFTSNGRLLFVVDSLSGDVAALLLHPPPAPPSLITLFPAGRRPADIAIDSFQAP